MQRREQLPASLGQMLLQRKLIAAAHNDVCVMVYTLWLADE
jgi:hypothetical protein